ncbi:MAG: AAA family ATPase, partial [Deltaproteobacteria bacterium]|nr:AAA family ATPase [Deltaproteobacteria bacterium]
MDDNLPYLPVGTQAFDKLRSKNGVYVDKTSYFPKLTEVGEVVFCARPRRFGKSLTVSTLDGFFSGRVELFRGLSIEEHMSSPDFTPRPVIRLDMSLPSGADSKAKLEAKIVNALQKNGKRHDVSPQGV